MTHRHTVSNHLHTHQTLLLTTPVMIYSSMLDCSAITSGFKVNKLMMICWFLFPDVASADQQKAAGPQQDQDEDQNDEDVAMETENEEEDLQAAEVQELKPEQLDSNKASKKGDTLLLLLFPVCF